MPLRIINICIAAGGWILLFLLAWQFRGRLLFKIDEWFPQMPESSKWEQIVESKKSNLRQVAWQDERKLLLMLGDSQVEMGNWNDLFQGRFAIRNAGLSRAKIKDVARVAEGITKSRPDMILLFCGINDLGSGRSVEDALKDYLDLLDQLGKDLTSDRLVILSIMPVAKIRLADGTADLNAKVDTMNASLQKHCEHRGITFINVSPAVSKNGMLREDLTSDGLHLNPMGYRELAAWMQPSLLHVYGNIENR